MGSDRPQNPSQIGRPIKSITPLNLTPQRDRLRQIYDKLFGSVGEALKREYPNASKNQIQKAADTVATPLDRSSTVEWLGVEGSPIQSAKAAIAKVLESLE